MEKYNLALFDLDGTLFDTRDVNYYAYRAALRPFGIELDKKYFMTKCNGRYYAEFLPAVIGNSDHLEEIHTDKKNIYAAHLNKARENKRLFDMIKIMKETYYIAIVTTASRKNTTEILHHFEYENLFECLITQEDITKPKPDPQGFLLAMEKFGIGPRHTIIFEDSDIGIKAAQATGSTVLVVNQF